MATIPGVSQSAAFAPGPFTAGRVIASPSFPAPEEEEERKAAEQTSAEAADGGAHYTYKLEIKFMDAWKYRSITNSLFRNVIPRPS